MNFNNLLLCNTYSSNFGKRLLSIFPLGEYRNHPRNNSTDKSKIQLQTSTCDPHIMLGFHAFFNFKIMAVSLNQKRVENNLNKDLSSSLRKRVVR